LDNWGSIFLICAIIYFPLKEEPKDVDLSPPNFQDEEEPEPHPLDKLNSFEALIQFLKSHRFWLIFFLNAVDGPYVNVFSDWMNYYLVDNFDLSEGQATLSNAILPFFRCISVLIGGFLCDYMSTGKQVILFTLTMFLSLCAFGTITFWEGIPIYMVLTLFALSSFFTSPSYYLAGQFFSVTFGGNKHCGFLDSIKDAISSLTSMAFSFLSGYIISTFGWFYLLLSITILGVISTLFVFLFQTSEYIVLRKEQNEKMLKKENFIND